jgi:hypothetical protein
MIPRFLKLTLATSLAMLAMVVFCVRGPVRAMVDSGDFSTVYAASRCWTSHSNPYRQANVDREYKLAKGDPRVAPNAAYTASVYAPTIFPLLSVMVRLTWTNAKRVWLAVNLLSLLASFICIFRTAPTHSRWIATGLLIAYLLFSPLHTGLAKGQPSVFCISLLVCSFYLPPSSYREILSGLMLGLSCCVKPNIALPYIVFCFWQRQWRVVVVSLVVAVSVLGAAIWQLHFLRDDWSADWIANLSNSALPGGSMDPTLTSSYSHLLINFQTVVGFFTTSQSLCNDLTYFLTGIALLWIALAKKAVKSLNEYWALVGFLSIVILLGSYHRYYDLQLLLLGTNGFLGIQWNRKRAVLASSLLLPLWIPLQALAGGILPHPAPGSLHSLGELLLTFLAFRNHPLSLVALAALVVWVFPRLSSPIASDEPASLALKPSRAGL